MRAALTRMTIPISIILLFSGNAVSADLVGDEQLIPPNPEIAIDTTQWGGFYLGAYGGYRWFSAKGANTTGGKKKGDGAKFGGFAGYNWQLNNDVVTGLEVLGGYSGAEESSGGVKLGFVEIQDSQIS